MSTKSDAGVPAQDAAAINRTTAVALPVPAELLDALRQAIDDNDALNKKLRLRLQQIEQLKQPADCAAETARLDAITRERVAIELREGHHATIAKALREFDAAHQEERAELQRRIEVASDRRHQREKRAALQRELVALIEQQTDAVDEYERRLSAAFAACVESAAGERSAYGAALSRVEGALNALTKLRPMPEHADGSRPWQGATHAPRRLDANPQPDTIAGRLAHDAIAQALDGRGIRGYVYLVEKEPPGEPELDRTGSSYRVVQQPQQQGEQ